MLKGKTAKPSTPKAIDFTVARFILVQALSIRGVATGGDAAADELFGDS